MTSVGSSRAADTTSNVAEFTVSELSGALKRTIEDAYGYVRVRGEISGFKRAASGHLYFALKDEQALIDGVCWRGTAGKLGFQPEDGLEVVASGRITTYAGRSKYQIVIDRLEPAGAGASWRSWRRGRKSSQRKACSIASASDHLPFLPDVIGVITSPTGAVIRDILHRIGERFPRHVLLWPVAVQGDKAKDEVAAAIEGFNRLPEDGAIPRPDVLIVARGGGSLEDLWAFNEEIVVRAAAASAIPLISAVGHETDNTLIDLAADHRTPTPTAAAELAVPVRSELAARNADLGARLFAATDRGLKERRQTVEGLARGLPAPALLLGQANQRLDELADRLPHGLRGRIDRTRHVLAETSARLGSPKGLLRMPAFVCRALLGSSISCSERNFGTPARVFALERTADAGRTGNPLAAPSLKPRRSRRAHRSRVSGKIDQSQGPSRQRRQPFIELQLSGRPGQRLRAGARRQGKADHLSRRRREKIPDRARIHRWPNTGDDHKRSAGRHQAEGEDAKRRRRRPGTTVVRQFRLEKKPGPLLSQLSTVISLSCCALISF